MKLPSTNAFLDFSTRGGIWDGELDSRRLGTATAQDCYGQDRGKISSSSNPESKDTSLRSNKGIQLIAAVFVFVAVDTLGLRKPLSGVRNAEPLFRANMEW